MRKPNTQCKICGKPLYRKPSELGRYSCCREHRSELYKKYKNYSVKGLKTGRGWNKGMSKKNGDELSYGKPRKQETKDKISAKLKGRIITEEARKKISEAHKALWDKIGRTEKVIRGWKSTKWKKEIYKQDDYRCKKCGSNDSIFAHHILSWKDYPELRFELSNGITLCFECHKKAHKGKTRNNPI